MYFSENAKYFGHINSHWHFQVQKNTEEKLINLKISSKIQFPHHNEEEMTWEYRFVHSHCQKREQLQYSIGFNVNKVHIQIAII